MDGLNPPLIIFEKHNGVLSLQEVHSSVAEAEGYHEDWQVEEGLLYGFDSVGQEIHFYLKDRRVQMRAVDKPAQPELLERLLREHLAGLDECSQAPDCDLPCLVTIAHEQMRITHKGCLPMLCEVFGVLVLGLIWTLPKHLLQFIRQKL